MNNVEQYDREINKLFEKLENRRQRARKTIPEADTKKYDTAFKVMFGAVCGGVGAALFHLGEQMIGSYPYPPITAIVSAGVVGGSCAVLGFFKACDLVDEGHITPPHLFGKATLISDYNARRINAWVDRYPRLRDLLGRWGAKNPSGQINSADFKALEKKIRKIRELENLRDQTVENENTLSRSGVTQAIKRTKLGRFAGGEEAGAETAAPTSKM